MYENKGPAWTTLASLVLRWPSGQHRRLSRTICRPGGRRYENFGEQSENVYENKGSVQKSTTPLPSLAKQGNHHRRAPLLRWRGVGGGGTLRPLRTLRLGVKLDLY